MSERLRLVLAWPGQGGASLGSWAIGKALIGITSHDGGTDVPIALLQSSQCIGGILVFLHGP